MNKVIQNRILNLIFFASLLLLYYSVYNSLLIKDIFDVRIKDYFNLILLLKLSTLIVLSTVAIMNIYSFVIEKRFENIYVVIPIVFFILATATIYFIDVNTYFRLSWRFSVPLTKVHKTMTLLALFFTFINIFISKDSFIRIRNKYKNIIIIISYVIAILSFYFNIYSVDKLLYSYIILFLIIISILGYSIKYLLNGSIITREILLFLSVYSFTTLFIDSSSYSNTYYELITQIFRSTTAIFLGGAFYRKLFTIYFSELENLNVQRKNYTKTLQLEIDERTKGLEQVNILLEKEITSARKLQESILPKKNIEFDDVRFITNSLVCERLSGDFFDIYNNDEDNIGMYILDVSGHGIIASLLSIFCYQYIRSQTPREKKYFSNHPDQNLLKLYQEFNRMNFPDEMHFVIFLANYNVKTKEFNYCSGGMNVEPIILKASGGIYRLDKSNGFPICKLGEHFKAEFNSVSIELEKGDRIFFYTDGLIEQKNKININADDIKEIMLNNIDREIEDIDNDISNLIEPYSQELFDDISYFILEIK